LDFNDPPTAVGGIRGTVHPYLGAYGSRYCTAACPNVVWFDLGRLIDPADRKVYIYQPDAEVECLDNPEFVSGEPLLKGFALKMKEVWG
jgi:hypothetical protein